MRFTLFLAAFCLFIPSAFAVEAQARVAGQQAASRFEPCGRITGRDRIRCEARIQRYSKRHERFNQHNVARTYERIDLGFGGLQKSERDARTARNTSRLQQRRTLRRLHTIEDVNTSRRSFLNQHRYEQLQCMLVSRGRPRRLCFERIGNAVRDEMRSTRGTIRNWKE